MAGQATDANMVHVRCMLDTEGIHKHSEYAIHIAFLQQWM